MFRRRTIRGCSDNGELTRVSRVLSRRIGALIYAQSRNVLKQHLKVVIPSTVECEAVKIITGAVAKRAGRLSAVPLAAIIVSIGALHRSNMVDIGVDESLVELYPNYEALMREAIRDVPEVGEGEKRIRIGISKDGSGVGAALIALTASKGDTRNPRKRQ